MLHRSVQITAFTPVLLLPECPSETYQDVGRFRLPLIRPDVTRRQTLSVPFVVWHFVTSSLQCRCQLNSWLHVGNPLALCTVQELRRTLHWAQFTSRTRNWIVFNRRGSRGSKGDHSAHFNIEGTDIPFQIFNIYNVLIIHKTTLRLKN